MSVHISDSVIFQKAWSTPELQALFENTALICGWIEVMLALAETEAEFGLIPADAPPQLMQVYRELQLSPDFLDEVRTGYEQSNHSLLGLIKALQKRSPADSGEW